MIFKQCGNWSCLHFSKCGPTNPIFPGAILSIHFIIFSLSRHFISVSIPASDFSGPQKGLFQVCREANRVSAWRLLAAAIGRIGGNEPFWDSQMQEATSWMVYCGHSNSHCLLSAKKLVELNAQRLALGFSLGIGGFKWPA